MYWLGYVLSARTLLAATGHWRLLGLGYPRLPPFAFAVCRMPDAGCAAPRASPISWRRLAALALADAGWWLVALGTGDLGLGLGRLGGASACPY